MRKTLIILVVMLFVVVAQIAGLFAMRYLYFAMKSRDFGVPMMIVTGLVVAFGIAALIASLLYFVSLHVKSDDIDD